MERAERADYSHRRTPTPADPVCEKVGRTGLQNAKLAGAQGAFLLAIVVLMVYLRFGRI